MAEGQVTDTDPITGDPTSVAGPPQKPTAPDPYQMFQQRQEQTEATGAEVKRLRDQEMALAEKPLPRTPPPNVQDVGPPPKAHYQNVFKEAMNPLIFLTAMGAGMMSKNHGMGAMKAATGFMEGFQQGDKARIDLEQKNWENNLKALTENNKNAIDRYKAVLNNNSLTQVEKQAQLGVISAQIGDTIALNQQRAGDMNGFYKLLEARERGNTQMQVAQIRGTFAQPERVAFDKFMKEHPDATSKEIQDFVHSMKAPRSAPGMMLQKFLQDNPDATPDQIIEFNAKAAGARAEATARMAGPARADAGALTALTKQDTAIRSFEDTAVKNGKMLVQLAEKVNASGSPTINRWVNAGRKQIFGDVDVNNFDAQLLIYRNEVAKIVNNPSLSGVLTVSATKEAANVLSEGVTLKQLKSLTALLEKDFNNRLSSNETQRQVLLRRLEGAPASAPAPASEAPASAPERAGGQPAGNQPQIGDERVNKNGVRGRWTGNGWEVINAPAQ